MTFPSLEKLNKALLLGALVALIYRVSNFCNTFLPKPFELVLALVALITLFEIIKNRNRISEFWFSVPKTVRIASILLVGSVLFGWVFAIFILGIPVSPNSILEFGTFGISLLSFILIIIHTHNDTAQARRYFYALILPVCYGIVIIFPAIAYYFGLVPFDNFAGWTLNVNTVAKTLLLPAIFFVAKSLFENQNQWRKFTYISLSAITIALIFWTASRGGILSLSIGVFVAWIIFIARDFNWRKIFSSAGIIFCIFFFGFILTPRVGMKALLGRFSTHSVPEAVYSFFRGDLSSVAGASSLAIKNKNFAVPGSVCDIAKSLPDVYSRAAHPEPETRLKIWPFYLRHSFSTPSGIGPNTHLQFDLTDKNGNYVVTGPHNTYIQVLFWGGFSGITAFLIIIFLALKRMRERVRTEFTSITIALFSVLIALSVSIMFDDSLSFYWFFIILGLSFRI